MYLNIVCTSKPCDGLLFYSYEYCSFLNSKNIKARLVIIGHRKFKPDDYLKTISSKYIHCQNIVFDDFKADKNDITLVMGRSMITLPYQDFSSYSDRQQASLRSVFSNKIISVYSENHPRNYPKAIDFFSPKSVYDLCDTEVYLNGVGDHFEKRINFDIYQKPVHDPQFKYLFLGTNKKYYRTLQKYLWLYPDHGIITYEDDYLDPDNNNIIVPTDNLLGKFDTFVYTKNTFDPAPRIIQECKYFGKNLIYSRDPSIRDGGSVYWQREISEIDIKPILKAVINLRRPKWVNNVYSTFRGQL